MILAFIDEKIINNYPITDSMTIVDSTNFFYRKLYRKLN